MTPYTVHTVPGSPFARAVMAILEEKSADWQIDPMAPGDHLREPHLGRQPLGKMPAITWDGGYFTRPRRSCAIWMNCYPGPRFTPDTIDDRARMNQAIGICENYLFPESARIIVFQRVVGPRLMAMDPDETAIAEAMPHSHTIFAELSYLLADRPWFGGANPSIADLMRGSQMEFFNRTPEWNELTKGRANLIDWLESVETGTAMQATIWEQLPERIVQQAA